MTPNKRVHIYAVIRIPVDVHAESDEEAIKKAESEFNESIPRINEYLGFANAEYAEEISNFGVDDIDENGECPEGNEMRNFIWDEEKGEWRS